MPILFSFALEDDDDDAPPADPNLSPMSVASKSGYRASAARTTVCHFNECSLFMQLCLCLQQHNYVPVYQRTPQHATPKQLPPTQLAQETPPNQQQQTRNNEEPPPSVFKQPSAVKRAKSTCAVEKKKKILF